MYRLTVEDVLSEVKSQRKGLTKTEAKNRLLENGSNEVKLTKPTSLLSKLLKQFNNVINWVLVVALFCNIISCIMSKDSLQIINIIIIAGVIILNVILGVRKLGIMEKSIKSINGYVPSIVKVQRDGKIMKVDSSELVIGDIIYLNAGDIVPADVRIINSNQLYISDTAITGQMMSVEKTSNIIEGKYLPLGDRNNMTYLGSTVTGGSGVGVVVATGKNTELGKTAKLLTDEIDINTPTIRKLNHVVNIMSLIILAVSVLCFGVNIIRDNTISNSFLLMSSLLVCIIPESLYISIFSIYSKSINNLKNKFLVVKSLFAVENLGKVDVLCIDKSKVLTINYKVVMDVWVNNTEDYDLENNPNFISLINCMLLCNNSTTTINADNKLVVSGESSEKALINYGYEFGYDKENLDGVFPRVNILPYDRYRKLMSTINTVGDLTYGFTRGEFERVFNKCSHILVHGKPQPLTEELKQQILDNNKKWINNGSYIMGFATKQIRGNVYEVTYNDVEENMTFIGCCAINNPSKDNVEDAIKVCKQAGIKLCVLTSDDKESSYMLAKKMGIATSEKQVITGDELDMMTDVELYKKIDNYIVFSKLYNGQKLRIVKALQYNDHMVAITGDNVEDLSALKRSDIGIGLGNSGCEVIKQASSVVAIDDNLNTIVEGVRESRKINKNLKKMMSYVMTTTISQILLVTVLAVCLNMPFFTTSLILLINFISGLLPCMGLGNEPIHRDVMNKKYNGTNRLFKGASGFNIIGYSISQYIIIALMYYACVDIYVLSISKTITMCFVAFMLMEVMLAFAMKNTRRSIFDFNPFNNRLLNIGLVVTLILSFAFVVLPMDNLHLALGTANINFTEWLISAGISLLIIPISEIIKIFEQAINERNNKNNKKTS